MFVVVTMMSSLRLGEHGRLAIVGAEEETLEGPIALGPAQKSLPADGMGLRDGEHCMTSPTTRWFLDTRGPIAVLLEGLSGHPQQQLSPGKWRF